MAWINRTKVAKFGSMVSINDAIGISHLERFKEYNLGNYVNLKIHWHKNTTVTRPVIEKAINFCVENKIYFSFSEFLDRYTFVPWKILDTLTKEDWEYFSQIGGKYFTGCHSICERGGSVYWPLGYKHDNLLLPQVENIKEAKENYVNKIKEALGIEKSFGRQKLETIDSSLLHKYHLEAGMTSCAIEMFPGNCDLMYPAVRGAVRGYGQDNFGVDVAMVWYGGVQKDELWFKRWQMSLYYAYMHGADWIISETGEFGMASAFGQKHDIDGPVCTRFRDIMKDFYAFIKENPRPAVGPIARIGIVHGQYDGNAGLWNKEVWGQYQDEQFLASSPEDSWQLVHTLLNKCDWFDACRTGQRDYSGNPVAGQFDIVPAESSLDILQQYSCLIFLGWNTMDEALYNKLINYVSNGGRLFMTLGHLTTSVNRNSDISLYNNGNVAELFGVDVLGKGEDIRHSGYKITAHSLNSTYEYPNWTENADPKFMDTVIPSAKIQLRGAQVVAKVAQVFGNYQLKDKDNPPQDIPALTEYSLGNGVASLVTLWGYPGSVGIKDFFEEILKCINIGEINQFPIKVCASSKIRYSLYQENGKYVMFCLNTDFDLPQSLKIFTHETVLTEIVEPASMKKICL